MLNKDKVTRSHRGHELVVERCRRIGYTEVCRSSNAEIIADLIADLLVYARRCSSGPADVIKEARRLAADV